MGDGAFSHLNVSETLPGFSMDLDCMDELFVDGCWLETVNGSEFLNRGPSDPSSLFDPSSLVWPTLETGDKFCVNHFRKDNQDEMVKALCATQNMDSVPDCNDNSDIYSVEDPESWKTLWIPPRSSPGLAYSMTDRMTTALSYMKDFIRDKEFLAQIWVPVNRGGKLVLRTNNLPFSLDNTCTRLLRYRDISVKYQFKAEEDSKELVLGLPGRVFLDKVPEWTPDVRFFRSDEYSRVDYAQQFDVRGTLALPVFEQGSRSCLGVVEVVMTTQQIMYRPELESVCRALEAVNLRSSDFLNIRNKKVFRASETVLHEIEEVLRSACEMYKLPLAQTWLACVPQGKEGCRHSTENYDNCVSTVDRACYIGDPSVQLFHEVCSEHHLLKGQGVAGRAFTTNQPCFSDDVTSFSKTNYPLSHHARVFNLRASVAIRLRRIHTGKDDYVLEFFLPTDCVDPQEQKELLVSLSMLIQRVCHNLRVLTDEEIEEENNLLVKEATIPKDARSVRSTYMIELQGSSSIPPSLAKCKSSDTTTKKSEPRHHRDSSNLKGCITLDEEYSSLGNVRVGKTGEKRRTKAEKTVTLQVLRQYFAGSLKDAAKSIGVCTTTLKRICRQHGIKRWPSRKIKKVGHSLQKLQLVIDSVQGASGGFQIDSFYSKFPQLASSNMLGTIPFSSSKQIGRSELPNMQPETGSELNPQAAASKSPSSSCSQSSYSSHSYSSRTEQSPSPLNDGSSSKSTNADENMEEGVLTRIRSEAEMKTSAPELLVMPRCHSHETISHHLKIVSMSSLQKSRRRTNEIREGLRVKVTYGDQKARFRMQTGMSYRGLLQEITTRFNIDDMSKYSVKYLDDDTEWVLLSCDDDLQECFDVCKSSKSRSIKLSLHLSNHRWRNI